MIRETGTKVDNATRIYESLNAVGACITGYDWSARTESGGQEDELRNSSGLHRNEEPERGCGIAAWILGFAIRESWLNAPLVDFLGLISTATPKCGRKL